MENEQKQENLNDQNIQEQEPKQMMPYVDNQDMKERATRFGTGGFAAIIYAVVTTICLYKNAYGIMTVLFAAATIGFLYYVCSHAPQSKAYDNREDKTSNPHTMIYYIGILLLGVSTFLTADRFLITCNYIGIYLLSMTVFFTCFCDADKWGVGKYIRAVLGAVFSLLGYLFRGFSDCYVYVRQREKKKSKAIYVLVGVLIALPFLVLMLIVLSEADAIFKYIVDRSIGNLQLSGNLAGFVMMLVAVFVIVYGIFCKMVIQPPKIDCEEKRMVEPMIGITFCGLLTALYAVFAIIQILSPFLGKQMLPAGYSYSEYARQGFFQLLFVAAVNLVIVLVCNRAFAESRVLRTILTIMCGCTYVMIGSSAVRMLMYIRAYHLTYLRVLVLFGLLVLVVLFTGTIIYLYKNTFPLMKYMIVACGGLYIAFALSHPDTYIARYNLACARADVQTWMAEDVDTDDMEIRLIDLMQYDLQAGSADRTPAVFEFLEWAQARGIWTDENDDEAQSLLTYHSNLCTSRRGIRTFNVSTYRGKTALENYLEN